MADKAKELSDVLCNRHNIGIYDEAEREAVSSLIREAIRPLVEAGERAVRAMANSNASSQAEDTLREELKGWSLQISDGANEKRK